MVNFYVRAGRETRRVRREAFTLIELLVVIGVLGLLAAIIVPAIVSAIDRAKEARCLANLDQWGKGVKLYLMDSPGQRFPLGGRMDPDKHGAWWNAIPEVLGVESLAERKAAGKAMPRPGKEQSMWVCPSASPDELSGYKINDDTGYCSYAYNMWIDQPGRHLHKNHTGTIRLPDLLRFSNVPDPSTFVVFSERKAGHMGYVAARYVEFRHGRGDKRRAGVVFADGHVSMMGEVDIDVRGTNTSQNRGGIVWDPDGFDPDAM